VHRLVDTLLDLRKTFLTRKTPPEAAGHFQAARREALLGVRALVDGALTRMGSQTQTGQSSEVSTPIPVD
jgi:hypothetical protein